MRWIALVSAVSFGFYGLIKKTAPLGARDGLALETGLWLPLALLYLWFAGSSGQGACLRRNTLTGVLLIGAGLVTSAPLLVFVGAAQRIRSRCWGCSSAFRPRCNSCSVCCSLASRLMGRGWWALHWCGRRWYFSWWKVGLHAAREQERLGRFIRPARCCDTVWHYWGLE